MKKMMLGLFFLLLSIWTLIYSYLSNATSIFFLSVGLLILGFINFSLGYVDDWRK